MRTHEVRYGGIGYGFHVVRREQSGYCVKVTGPYTTREQAEQEARERARADAEDALTRTDRWGHSCEKSAQLRIEVSA